MGLIHKKIKAFKWQNKIVYDVFFSLSDRPHQFQFNYDTTMWIYDIINE